MDPSPAASSGKRPAPAKATRNLWILAILLAFPSTGFVQKYAGLGGVAAYVAAVIGLVFLTAAMARRFAPFLQRHFKSLATLAIAGLAVSFVILHPLEDNKGRGKSSDRDEGLEMAVTRMAHGETPYYPSNKTAGPLSLLPGSIFLASPFVALGNSGYQNVFWLALFLFAAAAFLKDKVTALWLLAVQLAVSEAALYEFISGGDIIANGIFVALLFLYALRTWENAESPVWQRLLACVLLGIGLASRANFLLLTPLFGAALWRSIGLKGALSASSLAVLTTAAISLPFYLNDPAGFSPLGSRDKLGFADHVVPWAGSAIIGLTILLSCLGALWLLLQRTRDTKILFFRCCTLVTVAPMLCVVLLSTWISGYLDFGITQERFGLMYTYFAMLGWGHGLLFQSPGPKQQDTQTT
jgi:hypothetical protein